MQARGVLSLAFWVLSFEYRQLAGKVRHPKL